jgi:hypothetical protein
MLCSLLLAALVLLLHVLIAYAPVPALSTIVVVILQW